MDKRYFLIIIIIFICSINLFMIVNVSDVVGSASLDVGKYTFSLPGGFSLYNDGKDEAMISNPDSKIQIVIYTSLKNFDTFQNRSSWLKENYTILSNGTITSGDSIKIQSIFYQTPDKSENRSIFYFNKYNNNFKISIVGFNYDLQKNETIDMVTQIVDSARINYKVYKN